MTINPVGISAENLNKPAEKSVEELFQDIFVTMLSPQIDQSVSEYYSKILTVKPTVFPFMIDVLKAERINGYRTFDFLVTLQISPVIGPHIEVVWDRLTFQISSGVTKLTKFEHLKTEEDLPPNWQHIKKHH